MKYLVWFFIKLINNSIGLPDLDKIKIGPAFKLVLCTKHPLTTKRSSGPTSLM